MLKFLIFYIKIVISRLPVIVAFSLGLGLCTSSALSDSSAILARDEGGVQQSVVLFIDDGFDDYQELHHFFEANFDNYDADSYLQTTDKATLLKGIADFAANKIDEHTFVTVYYGGFGYVRDDKNWMIDNDQLIQLAQSHGANKPKKDGIPLFKGLVEIFSKQNPAGLVIFYYPQPTINEDAVFIKESFPETAIFFPDAAGNFIDITRQSLSQPLTGWINQADFIGEYVDNLDYGRYLSYCLRPSPYGCDGDLSAAEIAQRQASQSTDTSSEKVAVEIGCGEPIVTQFSQPLETVMLRIDSACRAGEIVDIDYAGYLLNMQLDDGGSAQIAIPLLFPEAEATLHFQDGSTASESLMTSSPEALQRLDRVVLSWLGNVQLDLHALSFRVEINSAEDVWRQTYCDSAPTVDSAHHLSCLDGKGTNPANLQIYTRERDSDHQQQGIIDFRIDYFDRGSDPSLPFCGDGNQAEVSFTTQRIIAGKVSGQRQYTFAEVACGEPLSEKVRYLRGAVDQIRVR